MPNDYDRFRYLISEKEIESLIKMYGIEGALAIDSYCVEAYESGRQTHSDLKLVEKIRTR